MCGLQVTAHVSVRERPIIFAANGKERNQQRPVFRDAGDRDVVECFVEQEKQTGKHYNKDAPLGGGRICFRRARSRDSASTASITDGTATRHRKQSAQIIKLKSTQDQGKKDPG